MARAKAMLNKAMKCPMCQNVHMFNNQKHEGVQLLSTRLNSCKKFKELSPSTRPSYWRSRVAARYVSLTSTREEGATRGVVGNLPGNTIAVRAQINGDLAKHNKV